MASDIVFQVRSLDARGNHRVVHAYESDVAAQAAIAMMHKRTGNRYVIVPVPNRPELHWGINRRPKSKTH